MKIKKLISAIPVSMSGLMLGTAAAGNLVLPHGNIFKIVLGGISFGLLLLLVMKGAIDREDLYKNLNNPGTAGIVSTFPMGIIILSAYIHSLTPILSKLIWVIGIIILFVLELNFIKNFILKFSIKNVYPSYFVAIVGIVVISVTAPVFNAYGFGRIIFWFGFIGYMVLLPIVLYRVIIIKNIPEPLLPTTAIFAAPGSLCLAGYINSFQEKNIIIIGLLVFLSVITLLCVLLYIPRIIGKFYPSYSAFTFPFVISAIAIKSASKYIEVQALKYLVSFEEIVAVLFVMYVLIRYMVFIYMQLTYVEGDMVKEAAR